MATRGRIGIMLPDESVLSCYHHWDSYPQGLGSTLKQHYNTRDKVAELIDGGDMSSCWTVGEDDNIVDVDKYGPNYYSSRGEECPPRLDPNKYDYLMNGEEYAYLFTLNDEWICYDLHPSMPVVAAIP